MSNTNQIGFESESNLNRLRGPSHLHFGMLRAAILLGLLGVAGRADVVYTNFASSGNTNAAQLVTTIAGSGANGSAAQSFVPQQDYILTGVSIALSGPANPGSFIVALMASDPATGGPGTILEQFTVTTVPPAATPVIPTVLTSVKNPALTANATYWLAVAGATSSAFGNWQSNTTADIATATGDTQVDVSSTGLAGPWTGGTRNGLPRGAFQVSGNPASGSNTPTISSIIPGTVQVGSPAFTLTVNGTRFQSGAVVDMSGSKLTTTFVSAVQVTAAVPANLLGDIGTVAITVSNLGSPASNAQYFTITPLPSVTISGLSPSSIKAGGPSFVLTITGTNFTSDATVNFGGTSLKPVTGSSATQLQVTIPAALIATAGSRSISVSQTAGTSNVVVFTVSTTSALAITQLNPSSALAGGDNFTLTITGSNFTADAIVHFGTSTLAPSVVTPTQIQVTVPSTLIATAGSPSVSVVEASGTSNAVTFPITTSTKVEIADLAPDFTLAGGSDFTLLVTGTNFASDATLHFGASTLTPFSVAPGQILVTVPAALTAAVGVPNVTVVQSSGTSNTLSFIIGLLPGQPLTMASSGVLQAGTVGVAYSSPLVATGGAPPYVWTLVNSALPLGLSLSTAGVISGMPTTAGTILFTAKATDGASGSVSRAFVLTIAAANSGASISTPSALPAGTVGLSYSQALTATGGTPPYSWALTSGALPAGLSFSSDGLIFGTPTAEGTISFTAQASDKVGAGSPKSFSLTINAASFGATRSGVLSQVASGGGWKTSLYLVNGSANSVAVVVNLWAETGSPLSLPLVVTQIGGTQNLTAASVNASIPANATLLIESDSQASVGATGWAEVLSTAPVTGFGVFHYTSTGGAISEATVPLESTFTPSFLLPYDGLNGFTAGVALTNLVASQPASVTATIFDGNGNQIGTQSISLPAGGHTAFLLTDKLPIATANRGIIEFSSDATTYITGFGLRINPAGGLTLTPKLQRP